MLDQQTRNEQLLLDSAINSTSLGFILVDADLSLIKLNASVSNLLYELEKEKTLPTEGDLTLFEKVAEIFKPEVDLIGRIKDCMAQHQRLDIKEVTLANRYFRFHLNPIETHVGEELVTVGVVVTIEDITEDKILDRSKDEFFSIASHELRTPLSIIRGNTSLIMQVLPAKSEANSDLLEMIEDIHSASVRLISIVNDFLDVSRMGVGKLTFKKEPFDLKAIIQSIVEEIVPSALEKKICLVAHLPEGPLPPVLGDPDRTKQILINLISNGIKFTTEGGITVATEVDGDEVKVSVKDTGKGIPEIARSLLFRKFQQAGDSLYTRDTTKGTGLGLYISKMLAEGMGGSIALESSEEGKGSVFSFTLPIYKQQTG